MFPPLPCLIVAAALLGAGPDHVIEPGHEARFRAALTPTAGELPDDLRPAGITIPRDRVEAAFASSGDGPVPCADAPLCVTLLHPSAARAGDRAATQFAIRVRGREAPALLAGITVRLDAAFSNSPFRTLGGGAAAPTAEATVVPTDPAAAAGLEDRFRALLDADADVRGRLVGLDVGARRVLYRFRTDDGDETLAVELIDRPQGRSNPREATDHFLVLARGGLVSPPDLPRRVHAAIAAGDDGSLRLQPSHSGTSLQRTWLETLLVALSALCLLALVLVSWPLARAAAHELRGEPLALALLAVGALLRLALPGRFVEMGIVFQLTEMAEALQIPRYGAAVPTLHHAVFQVAGVDHTVVAWTHKVLGALTLPLAAAASLALLERARAELGRALPALVAGGLALTPMLVRSDLTESNLVPVFFAFWAGLLAWQRLAGPARMIGATAGLGFACLARPELVGVVPVAWLLLCRPWRDDRGGRAAWGVGLGLLTLIPWQVAHVLGVLGWEVEGESLKLGEHFWRYHLWDHLSQTALWEPRLVPVATTALAALGLARGPQRKGLWVMALGGLAWIAVYVVDLSSASAPRLHVTGLLLWTLVAAVGGAWLWRRSRPLFALALIAWIASAAWTVPWMWAPTNEDTEVTLVDRASEHLAGAGSSTVLAVVSSSDEPGVVGHRTQRHVPRYRFARVVPLLDLHHELGGPDQPYYLQGVNCYAELDRDERGGSGLLSACAAVHRHFDLEPVFVETVPNHGNPRFQELGYYGPEPTFEVGLWRVRGARQVR